MPKAKIKRNSTNIDMTAMCDVAFLLLTFFMLTTKFKPDEPVIVDTPSSISEIKLPETDICQITIDKDGRVFFGIDGQFTRRRLLEKMGERYKIQFTPVELDRFALVSTFGIPISGMKDFLKLRPEERTKFPQAGIPIDSLTGELGDWVFYSRVSNMELFKKDYRIAVKGDRDSKYPVVKQVISTLQDRKINKFNFITSLEAKPE